MGTFLLKTSVKSQLCNQDNLSDHPYHSGINVDLNKTASVKSKSPSFSPTQQQSCSFKIEDILNKKDAYSLPSKQSKDSSIASSNMSSASSYCSSISSLSSPYQNSHKYEKNGSMEFLLSHANTFLNSNPFMNIGNAQGLYQSSIENSQNKYASFMDQLNFQKQQQDLYSLEYLKNHSMLPNGNFNSFQNNNMISYKNDTADKLAMIDQISKQIDSYNESSSSIDKKIDVKNKLKNRSGKLNESDEIKECESKLKKKKKAIDYEAGHGCCNDIGCCKLYFKILLTGNLTSLNWFICIASGRDQLPMCLRGNSEEQVHLASLFNTLIHHKKCRRTRTVFTGN